MKDRNLVNGNTVVLMGKIIEECVFSHEKHDEVFYTFKLEVPRFSDNHDVLPVLLSSKVVDLETLEVGKLIKITGQFRSFSGYFENESRLLLSVYAKAIEFIDEIDDQIQNPNEIEIKGFIGKLPTYRKTPFGREITDLLIAVNRSFHKSDYIPCITWGAAARYSRKLKVGENVKITGRIQSRPYQKKKEDGTVIDRVAYEVSVARIEVFKLASEEHSTPNTLNVEDTVLESASL